jgi:peptidoglycan/xylan/chitin deacetylase (PgdA/CDA1 family)
VNGATQLLRAAAVAGDAFSATRLSVLIFHRVLPSPDPLLPEVPDAREFDRILHLLRGLRVLTLHDALALRAQGRLPKRAAVITFDDGYADNAEVALPLLQRHGLAATFFISTGFLDGGRMFNDVVIDALRAATVETIDLAPLGLPRMPLHDVAMRRAAIDAVLPKVKYLGPERRRVALEDLLRAAGRPALPPPRMMSSAQVRALHQAGMEIGGHTVNHPILRLIPDAEAAREISQGRAALESLIDAPVQTFAYPNGGPGSDYDGRHARMVREQGFVGAVSTASGVVTADCDDMQLPRFTPWVRASSRWAAMLLRQRYRRQPAQRA